MTTALEALDAEVEARVASDPRRRKHTAEWIFTVTKDPS